jgi:hypothetical protein
MAVVFGMWSASSLGWQESVIAFSTRICPVSLCTQTWW